ncbi:MAG: aminopeptidase [Phycisphaerae bacterium]|nr:aminopeptidase [Phycisphaerae bacterium]
MRKAKLSVFVFACICFVLPLGCQVDYYVHLVLGELASLAATVPVADALDDPRLTEEEQSRLALTQEVRQFGIDRIGLFAGDAYTVFEMNGSEPAAYVLSASAKESLTSFRWDLLFVGLVATKGFFDQGMGEREADFLAAWDLDVYYTRADGFSTLGFLPDPVRQSNLRLDEIELATLILHEMTHSTVFKPSDMDFNESLATFVSRAAAQAWFDETFGADSEAAAAARVRFADKAVIDDYVNELFAVMTQYYEGAAARGESREEIIAGRQARFDAMADRFATEYEPRLQDPERWAFIADMEMDNARLLAAIRYQGSLADYQAVLDKVGGNFPDALAVFSRAAASPDSREYLRDWVLDP